MAEFFLQLFIFRNAGHQAWFIISMALFTCILALSAWCKNVRWTGVFYWAVFFHANTSVMAFVVCVLLQRQSYAYSTDCIWFNALMAGVYYGVYRYNGSRA